MSLNKRRIVLSGYYGFDNLGDESILFTIINDLKRMDITPVVLSGNPRKTSESFDVEAVDRMNLTAVFKAIRNSDGLISGGGSLLQDVTSKKSPIYYISIIKIAQLLRKPVYFYAQGVGPINQKWLKPVIRRTLSKCRFISVRDIDSLTFLKSIGVKKEIEFNYDPVFDIARYTEKRETIENNSLKLFLEKKPILISLRKWHNDVDVAKKMIHFVNDIIKSNPNEHFIFVPFHLNEDTCLLNEIKKGLDNDALDHSFFVEEELSISQHLTVYSSISMTIGVRLHSLILSAANNIPFLGISYDPKIEAFMKMYNDEPVFSIENWNNSLLKEKFLNLKNEKINVISKIKSINNNMHNSSKLGIHFLEKKGVLNEQHT